MSAISTHSLLVNFVLLLWLEETNAAPIKNGTEKIIRQASKVTGSMFVSRYANFTKMALVEKSTAPTSAKSMPVNNLLLGSIFTCIVEVHQKSKESTHQHFYIFSGERFHNILFILYQILREF